MVFHSHVGLPENNCWFNHHLNCPWFGSASIPADYDASDVEIDGHIYICTYSYNLRHVHMYILHVIWIYYDILVYIYIYICMYVIDVYIYICVCVCVCGWLQYTGTWPLSAALFSRQNMAVCLRVARFAHCVAVWTPHWVPVYCVPHISPVGGLNALKAESI